MRRSSTRVEREKPRRNIGSADARSARFWGPATMTILRKRARQGAPSTASNANVLARSAKKRPTLDLLKPCFCSITKVE